MSSAILLTGGTGSRLGNLTSVLNKHLITINDKFIIDYPLNSLKQMGVKNLTVLLGGAHFQQIVQYIQDGSKWGFSVDYVYQSNPGGIAQAINLCKHQVRGVENFTVCLGDNVYSNPIDWDNSVGTDKAQVVLAEHHQLKRFGVANIHKKTKAIVSIDEKPKRLDPRYHHRAVSGMYRFNQKFFEYFETLEPSARGEFEICDIINLYLSNNNVHYIDYKGFWSDAGVPDSLAVVNEYFL